MTREELLEDLSDGDNLKIYTSAGECFYGSVLGFGTSGLKLRRFDDSSVKRISYERIIEYDILENAPNLEEQPSVSKSGEIPVNVVPQSAVVREQLFLEEDAVSLESLEKELISRLTKDEKTKYGRISNIISHAKKNHEYTPQSHYITKAATEYKKLAIKNPLFYGFIGFLCADLNVAENAVKNFIKGGCYRAAYEVAKTLQDADTALMCALLLVREHMEDEGVVRRICEAANIKNDDTFLKYLANCGSKYFDKALVYRFYDKAANFNDPFSDESINSLKLELAQIPSDFQEIFRLLKEFTEHSELKTAKDDRKLTGKISYFDDKLGRISVDGGSEIYFHMNQVMDSALQVFLENSDYKNRRVAFFKRLDQKGRPAGDEVELVKNESGALKTHLYSGNIKEWDNTTQKGVIECGANTYNFSGAGLKDPFLRAALKNKAVTEGLKVKFNLHSSDARSAILKARDIVGDAQYGEDVIKELVYGGDVTARDVCAYFYDNGCSAPAWLSVTEYQPIGDNAAIAYSVSKSRPNGEKREKNGASLSDDKAQNTELQICRRLIPEGYKNEFIDLPSLNGHSGAFNKAYQYFNGSKDMYGEVYGVDFELAEQNFILAIQSNDQPAQAVTNLANLYIQRGGEFVKKGIMLLEAYGRLIGAEKLTNIRLMLVERSGDTTVLEEFLLLLLPRCSKKNTLWQFTARLAGIYANRRDWVKAAEKYKECLNIIDVNRRGWPQLEAHRQGNLKNYIISSYNAGNKTLAAEQARRYLKMFSSEDEIINQIEQNRYNPTLADTGLEEFELLEDLQFENELLTHESEISVFLKYKLSGMNLSNTFNKNKEIYSKTREGEFIGNADDARSAVRSISNILRKKDMSSVSTEFKSDIYLGIAKIISDSRSNCTEKDANKIALDELKSYCGKFAKNLADSYIERDLLTDSIRFLYIQALEYLGKGDGNHQGAINMLMASFFVDSPQLKDEYHNFRHGDYVSGFYRKECLSVKDFAIATFMLQDRREYVNHIFNNVSSYNAELKQKLAEFFARHANRAPVFKDRYEFESLWNDAKAKYNTVADNIKREIQSVSDDYDMVESIRRRAEKIRALRQSQLLWNLDERLLDAYTDILNAIAGASEAYTIEEKIKGYTDIEADIAALREEIEKSPSRLGYECLYDHLQTLGYKTRSKLDELYGSSHPECSIRLSGDSVYVKDNNKVEISISFNNAINRQAADAVEINVACDGGAEFERCEKKFTSIKGGEEREYIAVFALSHKELEEQQFDITVSLTYKYHETADRLETNTQQEILPVAISDKKNFKPILNKYSSIVRGSSVKAPEMFKGRDRLIDDICVSLSSKDGSMIKNRGIILWGQRRVGKNSVKDYLKEKVQKRYGEAYIPIELGSLGKCGSLKEFLVHIINATEDELMKNQELYERLLADGVNFSTAEMEAKESYMSEFSRIMARLLNSLNNIKSDENKNIPLYYIDEFSYLYEWIEKGKVDGKDFMRFWKSFVQDFGICIIIIAQDNIPVWKSNYKNEFACMNDDNEITYLEYDGAKELICEPCRTGEKELFTQDAVSLINYLTLGSAYLIVIFCDAIIDYLNENYIETATKTVVQLVLEKKFADKPEGLFTEADFEPQIVDAAYVGDEAKNVERQNLELLKEIALATISVPKAKIRELPFIKNGGAKNRETLDRLKKRKIILTENDEYCSVYMPLLKLHLLREQGKLTKDVLNKHIR